MKKTVDKPKQAFSKALLIQESILIWIITLAFIVLAFICVFTGYLGSLPWVAVMVTAAWGAYGVSQAAYYSKSKAENITGGLVYEATMAKINNPDQDCD
jgi:EamA domain-containing membrane protein RarD